MNGNNATKRALLPIFASATLGTGLGFLVAFRFARWLPTPSSDADVVRRPHRVA